MPPASALASTSTVASLIRTLELFEPESLTDTQQLPLPPHTRAEELQVAWEIYHHDRGRGLN